MNNSHLTAIFALGISAIWQLRRREKAKAEITDPSVFPSKSPQFKPFQSS